MIDDAVQHRTHASYCLAIKLASSFSMDKASADPTFLERQIAKRFSINIADLEAVRSFLKRAQTLPSVASTFHMLVQQDDGLDCVDRLSAAELAACLRRIDVQSKQQWVEAYRELENKLSHEGTREVFSKIQSVSHSPNDYDDLVRQHEYEWKKAIKYMRSAGSRNGDDVELSTFGT